MVQVILFGINKHADCFKSLFSELEHYQLYNLYSLNRIDRIAYVFGKLRAGKVRMSLRDVYIITKEKNMCAIEGMIKTILMSSKNKDMTSQLKFSHKDVVTALNGRL